MSGGISGEITAESAATIVPRGAPISLARPLTMLESLGRRIVLGALGRLQYGHITLIDGDVRHESRGSVDTPTKTCVVRVKDRRFYSAAAFGGTIGIAEAYMDGAWEADDLPGLIETLTMNVCARDGLEVVLNTVRAPIERARMLMRRNTLSGSRRNIRAHYDLSNEFFGLFLDPTMTYSCAIFENAATPLEAAQVEKIDRACRKLELRATDHLLEIGTGWGALALHAARKYGCRVTTTTISERQHEMAERRIRESGLQNRITLVKEDYRNLTGTYDKIVSIEMVEAVGAEHIDGYFRQCSRLLKQDGAALIQAIVIRDQFFASAARSNDFLKQYIFPGSCLLSVQRITDAVMRRTDMRVWNLDDIGPHYVRTLALWREAFHARLGDVRALGYDERFVRMWDYYLAYCEGAFRARHVGDVQVLLTKPMWRGGGVEKKLVV